MVQSGQSAGVPFAAVVEMWGGVSAAISVGCTGETERDRDRERQRWTERQREGGKYVCMRVCVSESATEKFGANSGRGVSEATTHCGGSTR